MRLVLISLYSALAALAACQSTSTPATSVSQNSELNPNPGARDVLVASQEAYRKATKSAQPGDTIILQNGVWMDFDMLLDAKGTADAPITVKAQTQGDVVLSGQSSLRLAGEHLVVSGLVFRDGYTPRAEVISFRRDSKTLAFNTRVTQTVIENYTNPDRTQRDIWVIMYGRNNRFDHNALTGKLNSGPTMAVRLNTEDSRDNKHVIANNYFGPRPVFGSNGGETLRIGTSQYSLTTSGTLVENNYFDRCSGEVEIISNKSGGNTYRGNTFFQSRGTLTLRHGDDTLVENNLFDGDGAPYTGGVRVINARQTVRNNMFKDLTGARFSGGLVVMNGVPNSPINRYHQVDRALIEHNTFDNVTRIELAEGSDKERSAVPVNSTFRSNLVIGAEQETPFRLYDDLSGVSFSNNVATAPPPDAIASGFSLIDHVSKETRPDGVGDAVGDAVGAKGEFGVSRDAVGVDGYPKAPIESAFEGGESVLISPGADSLANALSAAKPGDRFLLAPGEYAESKLINLQIPLTFAAADPSNPPLITFERPNLFILSGDGALRLESLRVSGANAPDASGNSFISTSAFGGGNHVVEVSGSTFSDFNVNRGFSVVEATKGTFYDRIHVKNSAFEDVTGSVFKLDAERDDFGIYNAEFLEIDDSRFARIGGPVADVYRGGRDESTFGPHVWVTRSEFSEIGGEDTPLMRLHGVQNAIISGNALNAVQPIEFTITTGKPKTKFADNVRADGDTPVVTSIDLR